MLAAAPASAPVSAAERVLRIAVADWIPGLGNPYASSMNGAIHPFGGMFDALTVMGDAGEAEPNLALSWSRDNDTTWRFVLRPDVRFANGEPCDAGAVAAMVAWLKRPEAQRYVLAAEAKSILAAEALDARTVRIVTAAPDAVLPKRLSLLPLVPPAYWAKVGPEQFAQAPIGTGPYALKTWGRDRGRYILVRNPESWRGGALDRVEYIVLPDSARRAQATATGEADMAYNIDFAAMDFLKDLGIPTSVREMAVVAALALSTMRPDSALADVRVRQALNYAVDRDAIARVVLRGVVAPNGQGVVAGVFGYDPAIAPYPYDPAKARALLREAGRDRGLHLKASVIAKGAVEGEAIYQRVAQDLAQVGVTLDVRNVFGSDWVQMWVSGDWRGADMVSAVWNGATFLDAIRAVEPFACARPGAFFCDAEVDRLIAASNGTFDAKVREGQLKRVLARLHDLAPSIYLFPQPELIGVAPRVRDVTYRGRYVDWGRITVAP